MTTISVAMATYNHEAFIGPALDSVLAQERAADEIVIADDASTDRTPEILREYAARDPRIRLLFQPRNVGLNPNFTVMLRACTGDYVAFLGGDDLMRPGRLARCAAVLDRQPSAALVYHDLRVFESATNETLHHFNHGPHSSPPLEGGASVILRNGCFMGAVSVMARRAHVPPKPFEERLRRLSDWFLWFEIAARSGGTIAYVDSVLGDYRRHAGNVTAAKLEDEDVEVLVAAAIAEAKYPRYAPDARWVRGKHWYAAGVKAAQAGSLRDAHAYFYEAVRQGYVSWKTVGWLARAGVIAGRDAARQRGLTRPSR